MDEDIFEVGSVELKAHTSPVTKLTARVFSQIEELLIPGLTHKEVSPREITVFCVTDGFGELTPLGYVRVARSPNSDEVGYWMIYKGANGRYAKSLLGTSGQEFRANLLEFPDSHNLRQLFL